MFIRIKRLCSGGWEPSCGAVLGEHPDAFPPSAAAWGMEPGQKSARRAVGSVALCHTDCLSQMTAEQTYEITIGDDYIGSED